MYYEQNEEFFNVFDKNFKNKDFVGSMEKLKYDTSEEEQTKRRKETA